MHIKSNLAPMGNAIGYELKNGIFRWTGISDLTAQRILSAQDSEGVSARDEAVDFLRDELANGPVDATQVKKNATIDWSIKESVRARITVMVKRLLRQYGYPPDKQAIATETVLQQAQLFTEEWVRR